MNSIRILDTVIYYLLFAYALVSGISRGGVNITIISLTLVAIIRYIYKPFSFQVDSGIIKAMLVLAAALLVSSAFSGHILIGAEFLATTILKILPFFIVLAFVKSKQMVERIVWFMAISLLLGSSVGIWQGMHGAVRAKSFLGIMDFAGVIGLVFPMLFVYGFEYKGKTPWKNVFFMFVAGVATIALLFNGTRSIWIAVFVSIIIYTMLNIMRNKKVIVVFTLILMMGIGIGLASPKVAERVYSIVDTKVNISNLQRINMWKYGWNIFLEHPILGVGLGCLPHGGNFDKTVPEPMMDNIVGDHIHNNFLQMLAENGIVGFGAFCYCFSVILQSLWKRMRSEQTRVWATIGILCTIDFLVHGFFDYSFRMSIVMYTYWFILGLAYVNFYLTEEKNI
jgi:O-antigen ligase